MFIKFFFKKINTLIKSFFSYFGIQMSYHSIIWFKYFLYFLTFYTFFIFLI